MNLSVIHFENASTDFNETWRDVRTVSQEGTSSFGIFKMAAVSRWPPLYYTRPPNILDRLYFGNLGGRGAEILHMDRAFGPLEDEQKKF